jgi:hypothetical protein
MFELGQVFDIVTGIACRTLRAGNETQGDVPGDRDHHHAGSCDIRPNGKNR